MNDITLNKKEGPSIVIEMLLQIKAMQNATIQLLAQQFGKSQQDVERMLYKTKGWTEESYRLFALELFAEHGKLNLDDIEGINQ